MITAGLTSTQPGGSGWVLYPCPVESLKAEDGSVITHTGRGYEIPGSGLHVMHVSVLHEGELYSFWSVVHTASDRRVKMFDNLEQAQKFTLFLLKYSSTGAWLDPDVDDEAPVMLERFNAYRKSIAIMMSIYGATFDETGEALLRAPPLVFIHEP